MLLNKKTVFQSGFIVFTSILAASCVTETATTSPAMKFSDVAVVSVQDPSVSIGAGSTFSWVPDRVHYYDDKRLKNAPVKSLIENEIINNLKAKSMGIIDSADDAGYVFAYTAALESSLDDSAIIHRFGLLPGNSRVPKNDVNVEKGSLIIYVFNNKTNEIVWRSAAQIGVKFDMPAAERKQRVKHVLAKMFLTFPVTD